MKEPEGNCRPRPDAVFREIFTRGVRPCLHRRSDSGRNARLSEMLEPAPRSVEDPRRALSMPRLPGNPFGQEGHRFRKEARSLMKQVAISLLPVSGLPQEGHLRCTRAQVPGIADRRTDKARAVPVGFRERSDALLRTSGGGRSGSEGPLGRPPVACRHIDNLSYTHPSEAQREGVRKGRGRASRAYWRCGGAHSKACITIDRPKHCRRHIDGIAFRLEQGCTRVDTLDFPGASVRRRSRKTGKRASL